MVDLKMTFSPLPRQILVIVAVMLLLAIAPLPEGYYTLLQFIVCGCAAYMVCQKFLGKDRGAWLLALALIAIIFNPVVPLPFSRAIWIGFDLIAGPIFLYLAYKA